MRWTTKREIEAAAKKGPLAALDNSIEKYEQTLNAPTGELKAKARANPNYFGGRYCACCLYVHEGTGAWCGPNCPLRGPCTDCDDMGYRDFGDAFEDFRHDGPITPVRKAIRKLIRNMKKARKILKEQSK